MLHAERNLLRAEKRAAQFHSRTVAGASTPADRAARRAQRPAPRITLIRLGQSTWVARFNCRARAKLSRGWSGVKRTKPVSSSPRRPARPNICRQLVGLHLVLEVSREIARVGDEHRAHGEVDAGGQAHRRDHDVELPAFASGSIKPARTA